MRIVGVIFCFFGIILCLSILGAIIGIPLILLGLLMIAFGGRRKTIINNVIQVSNNSIPQPTDNYGTPNSRHVLNVTARPRSLDTVPRNIERAPFMPRQSIPEPEFEVEYYEENFVDTRSELSQNSRRILGLAKKAGCQIVSRPDCITVSRNEEQRELRSNAEIDDFGRHLGFA